MYGNTGNVYFEPKQRKCSKHGILEESLVKSETIKLGSNIFCEKCVLNLLAQFKIVPLELEIINEVSGK